MSMPISAAAFSQRKILVAGGTGFIGRRLVAKLLAAGANVTILHRGRSPLPAECQSLVVPNWTQADLASALTGLHFDGVFNLAAYGVMPAERDPETMSRINVAGADQFLRHAIAMDSKFFIHAGSSAEYRERAGTEPLLETDPLERVKLYGASKAAATEALLAAAHAAGFPLIVGRLFGVYGAGEAPHRLLPSLVAKLNRGERVPLSEGHQVRDFVHVDDAAEGFVALASAARTSNSPAVVNLCSGEGVSVRDFARHVARAMAVPETLLGFGDLALRPDDVMHLIGSTAALQSLCNWRPRLSIDAGISEAVAKLGAGKE